MVTVRLRIPRHADRDLATLRADLVGGVAGERRVEHVYAEPTAGGVAVVLFVPARSLHEAERWAAAACERVIRARRAGIEVLSCGVEIFLPATRAGLGECGAGRSPHAEL
jgi:hypothetical protein